MEYFDLDYFNKELIKNVLPHRDPMLLVDEVLEMVPEERIKTKFFVDSKKEIFKGFFPGEPMLPGAYTIECMAQTADILLLSMKKYKGTIPLFLGVDNVKFLKKIKPKDTIEVIAKIIKEREDKGIATCSAEVYNNGELSATGDVTLAMR